MFTQIGMVHTRFIIDDLRHSLDLPQRDRKGRQRRDPDRVGAYRGPDPRDHTCGFQAAQPFYDGSLITSNRLRNRGKRPGQ